MDLDEQREWLGHLLAGIGSRRTPDQFDPGYPFEGFLGRPEKAIVGFLGTNPGAQKPSWLDVADVDDHLLERRAFFDDLARDAKRGDRFAISQYRDVWEGYAAILCDNYEDAVIGYTALHEWAVVTNVVHLPTRSEGDLRKCSHYAAACELSQPLTRKFVKSTSPGVSWVIQSVQARKHLAASLSKDDGDRLRRAKQFTFLYCRLNEAPADPLPLFFTYHLSASQSTIPLKSERIMKNREATAIEQWPTCGRKDLDHT